MAAKSSTRMIKAILPNGTSFGKFTHVSEILSISSLTPASSLLRFPCVSTFIISCRSVHEEKKNGNSSKSIVESKGNVDYSQLTLGGKVKQASKDAYYTGIVIAGLGVTAVMFYAIFRELFSKTSPNNVYTDALKLCRKNSRVVALLGEPIKGYGEMSSRGRRRHVSHLEYIQDGVNHMRMKFYIEGSLKKATVHLEMIEDTAGKYVYRYLFVESDDFPKRTIVLEDNRYKVDEIKFNSV